MSLSLNMNTAMQLLKLGNLPVCRKLFQEENKDMRTGVNDDQTHMSWKKLFDEFQKEAETRWNFDFKNDRPLDGHYVWEESRLEEVPLVYHPTIIAGKRKAPSCGTEDAVYEKENDQGSLRCQCHSTPKRLTTLTSKKVALLSKKASKPSKQKQTTINDYYLAKRRMIQSSCPNDQKP
ncbi:cyclin-dependent kinase inhibitor 1 [Protopterus annectens]|uniref:cyclin-dependent kinase inhibitor 1 n=1 Tax=Protopterus annectens TaxID=7888 RepID=UPI001CF9CFF4|nr:cyclin-dependent kinase inhibitor 1 [Protopterus annectens]